MKWETVTTLLIGTTNEERKNTNKYACFDFDETLVTSKSHSKFIRDKNDWQFTPLKI